MRYIRPYLRGVRTYVYRNRSRLRACVEELQSIEDKRIRRVVRETPASLLTPSQKNIMLRFLLRRKRRTDRIIDRWIEEFGRCRARSRCRVQ